MAKKIKWGVIGSGGIARRRTIPEGIIPAGNAELTVVLDADVKINAQVAKQFNVQTADSLEALLAEDIDAVYIATPANLHHHQVLAFAKAGKHILCEKPLGLTVPQAQEMISVCQQAGVLLGAAFMMRFHSQHRSALEMIQQGKLGKPVYARAQLSCWYPPIPGAWRQNPASGGGGSLMDMGGHCIDLLEMFLGPASRVSCFVNNSVHGYASEDSATAMLQFQSGALATIDTFFCIPDESSKNVLELYGSKGSILAKGTIGQADAGEMIAYLQAEGADYQAQQTRSQSRGQAISPKPVNTYRAEIEEFSEVLLDNRQPANDAQLGLRSQKVLAACYESARIGKVVAIE